MSNVYAQVVISDLWNFSADFCLVDDYGCFLDA